MQVITRYFPLWAILLSCISYLFPQLFIPIKSYILPLLIIIMFGMGMTLTLDNFKAVLRSPLPIVLGVILQFSLMPFYAWFISDLVQLGSALAIGMILLGSAPGGTASNVICYLAKANVALSVSMTLVSTLLSIVMMPLLTRLYIGESVNVPVTDMMWNLVKLILLPVGIGCLLNTLYADKFKPLQPLFPALSSVSIILIIAIIVALNHKNLADTGFILTTAIMLHNLAGLISGYFISRFLKLNKTEARTIAIEVGMQNSGLAVALAVKYFGLATALPGALFSIWHNISGSILAAFWARKQN